mmetsp:Transcript_18764/g.54416  ORF Transcript_18764/g.54416 Transcript_18764/m.54416 type:complete len:114 (+) Transcript_18764:1132-1473(+)
MPVTTKNRPQSAKTRGAKTLFLASSFSLPQALPALGAGAEVPGGLESPLLPEAKENLRVLTLDSGADRCELVSGRLIQLPLHDPNANEAIPRELTWITKARRQPSPANTAPAP